MRARFLEKASISTGGAAGAAGCVGGTGAAFWAGRLAGAGRTGAGGGAGAGTGVGAAVDTAFDADLAISTRAVAGPRGVFGSAVASVAGGGGVNLCIVSKSQVPLWTSLLVSGCTSSGDDGGRSGNPFCMNIVAKSRTGRYWATEFVAAPAKRRPRPWLAFGIVAGLAVGSATGLGGCSSTLGSLPTELGGLPAGTPERPATPAAYPAVHDMPPPRPNTVLTEDEQKKTEAELAALRARQEKAAGMVVKGQPPQQ